MRKITLLLLVLSVSLGYAQTNLEDLEGSPVFNGFEGLGSATVTADPVNGANTVGEIITSAAGQSWQGAELIMQGNMIDLTVDKTVQVDIYSDMATAILGKVEDKVNNTAPASADAENHGGTGWETITFTFTSGDDGTVTADGEYSQIAFFPLWANGGGWDAPVDGMTIYVDNVTAQPGASLSIDDFNIRSFKAYPNPAQDHWMIETTQNMLAIEVYDMLGKNVLTAKPNNNFTRLDASELPTGLYFARIETINGINSVKLIKK